MMKFRGTYDITSTLEVSGMNFLTLIFCPRLTLGTIIIILQNCAVLVSFQISPALIPLFQTMATLVVYGIVSRGSPWRLLELHPAQSDAENVPLNK